MGATVYFWHTFRFDVFCVNPPLTRMVSGLPVVLCQPKCDWDSYSPHAKDRSEWVIGGAFVASNGSDKSWWCFRLARWSLIPFLLLGGYFGWRLSRDVYGDSAGLVFLIMWCFSPLLLAWGATICPDAVAGALGLGAVYMFRKWLYKPNWARAAICGLWLGVLPLTKLTWIAAFGIWPLIWGLWVAPICLTKAGNRSLPVPPWPQLAIILIVGLYTLNMGYLFDGTCRPLGKHVFLSKLLGSQESPGNPHMPVAGNRYARTWAGGLPVPLPAAFIQGIDLQRYDFERGATSYLRGTWADHGWWYYYLYALAVKVPLGTWFIVTLAIAVTAFGRGYSASWRDEMLVLAPGLLVFVLVSSQTGFSAHSRYILPALPFFLLWASKVGRAFEVRPATQIRRTIAGTVVVALTWLIASSLWAYPHSLSYFNGLVGGPRYGGEHLMGSNVDWGQDLFYLKDWIDQHPEVDLRGLAIWGAWPTTLAGIPNPPPPPVGPTGTRHAPSQYDIAAKDDSHVSRIGPKPGWYALSVSHVYNCNRRYRYFQYLQPDATAGYSIYIYHITLEEANHLRRELGLPELLEDWEQDQERVSLSSRPS